METSQQPKCSQLVSPPPSCVVSMGTEWGGALAGLQQQMWPGAGLVGGGWRRGRLCLAAGPWDVAGLAEVWEQAWGLKVVTSRWLPDPPRMWSRCQRLRLPFCSWLLGTAPTRTIPAPAWVLL